MSFSSQLTDKTASLRRKLFDNAIKRKGTPVKVRRVRVGEKSKYGDSKVADIISRDDIELYIEYPDEVPLLRHRANPDTVAKADTPTGVFFYEILPITVFSRFADNVERGDIIIHEMKDENGGVYRIALQIMEQVAKWSSSLTWKKSLASLYQRGLPAEVDAEIKRELEA